jgi:hypothetical protein
MKGFLKSILDFAKVIASVFLSYVLMKPVGKLFDSWFMNNAVSGWVKDSINKSFNGESGIVDFLKINQDTPGFYKDILTNFGLDYNKFNEEINNLTAENVNELGVTVGNAVSFMLSCLLAIVVIFIISMIVLSIVVRIITCVTKIGGLRALNRVLGLVLGIALALVLVWGVTQLAQLLINTLGPMWPDVISQKIINESMILSAVKNSGIEQLVMEQVQ